MKNKLLVIVFLAILVVQPLVAFSGSLANSTQAKPTKNFDSSQDAGTRLEPGAHTNHVPFVINSTADFAVQGWPGSGTSGDPYVIAGLNITTTIAQQCIQIGYTDAYFVIRDCYLDTASLGVFLPNATHGRVEYTTILSNSMGVYAIFSDNLVVSHTHIESLGQAFQIFYCEYSTVEWSVLECPAGIYTMFSNHFTSAHNYVHSDAVGGMGVLLMYSNHSTSSFDTIVTTPGGYGFYGANSYYLSISDLIVDTASYGIIFGNCPSSEFTRCTVSNADTFGGFFASSPDLSVTESTFSDNDNTGVMIASSNNSIFMNNIIEDSGIMGLQVLDCDDAEVSHNVIMNTVSGLGIYADQSHDLVLDSNTVEDSFSLGIQIDDCARLTITNTDVFNSGSYGIFLSGAPNATISDCEIVLTNSYGIYLDTCDNSMVADNMVTECFDANIFVDSTFNISIYGNQLVDGDSFGIYIAHTDNSTVENNVIANIDGTGIRCEYSDYALISHNDLDLVEDGIHVYYSDDVTVDQNSVTDAEGWAMYVYYSDRAIVTTNTLDSAFENGILVSFASECVFNYNTMTNCGFNFNMGYAMDRYNHSMIGNAVNGKPVYYAYNQDSDTIAADSYGQIILLNCTFMEIEIGTFTRATVAVELLYCTEVVIRDLECFDNYRTFQIYNSDNVTVIDSVFQGRKGDQGIKADYGLRLQIEDCTFSNFYGSSNFGVFLQNADYTAIANCTFDHNWWGVRYSSTDHVTVVDCTILNSGQYGIYAWGSNSDYVTISGNTILNATKGVYMYRTSQGLITDNIIMYCSEQGIYLYHDDAYEFNITLNTIENNFDGVYVLSADDHFIMNNTIRWNSQYGLRLAGSTGTEVYYNLIALNGLANGIDSLSGNYWDDGVSLGNTWDDYTPPGIYYVDGSGGNTDDRFPMQYLPTLPIVNQPQDIYYEELTTGNELVWHPFDDSLRDWEVTIDGVLWESDAWNYVDITVIIDDLEYGTHIAVVTVWDIHSNSVTDTVEIHVFDGTDPGINGPANTIAFADGTGQTLTWEVADLHPGEYEVIIDDVVTATGTWTTGTVTASIDGLAEGVRVVQLWIYDLDNNFVMDTVLVEVIDDNTTPTIDSPDDIAYVEGTIGN
ncbi:MAG: right-handed parallel beta-helix repeat-containing protein, partial [Candidatus Thorarchaeota archaeon]